MAADDDLAAELLRLQHDAAQVLDLGVNPPLLGVGDLRVRDRSEVRGDRRVLDPTQVVVEHLLRRGLPGLRAVEDRLVLEQVLAPLDRPDLPARRLGDEALGQRREVRGAGRGPGVEHQDVAGLGRADLQDADIPWMCCATGFGPGACGNM
ncbi:hypothetical protein [Baekduia alba]|uniref:hypothetical protein n=1 Tax=Baekduia alba TaxID=2997333 RepID=UPI002340C288|nr:hypothetical protein [Baekduia alba]